MDADEFDSAKPKLLKGGDEATLRGPQIRGGHGACCFPSRHDRAPVTGTLTSGFPLARSTRERAMLYTCDLLGQTGTLGQGVQEHIIPQVQLPRTRLGQTGTSPN